MKIPHLALIFSCIRSNSLANSCYLSDVAGGRVTSAGICGCLSRGQFRRDWERETAMRNLIAFLKDDSGTETLEWGLVCGLIVVGAITAITLIGPKVTDMWNDLNNEIPAATP